MKLRLTLVVCTLMVSVAASCTSPKTRIDATNLRDNAIDDTGTSDPFIEKLDKMKETFERGTLVANPEKFTIDDDPANFKPALLQAYARGRQTQINDLCQIYFDGLHKQSQVSDLATGLFSIATNTASAVMGLTGAASAQLAYLALGEAAVLDSSDKIEEVYLIAPNPEIVHGLVKEAQKQFGSAQQIASITDYAAARNFVRNYASLCTPIEIKRITELAIENSKITFSPKNRTLEGAIQGGLSAIADTIGQESLSIEQATNLFIVHGSMSPKPSPEQTKAAEAALGDLKPNAAQIKQLKRVFAISSIRTVAAIRDRAAVIIARKDEADDKEDDAAATAASSVTPTNAEIVPPQSE